MNTEVWGDVFSSDKTGNSSEQTGNGNGGEITTLELVPDENLNQDGWSVGYSFFGIPYHYSRFTEISIDSSLASRFDEFESVQIVFGDWGFLGGFNSILDENYVKSDTISINEELYKSVVMDDGNNFYAIINGDTYVKLNWKINLNAETGSEFIIVGAEEALPQNVNVNFEVSGDIPNDYETPTGEIILSGKTITLPDVHVPQQYEFTGWTITYDDTSRLVKPGREFEIPNTQDVIIAGNWSIKQPKGTIIVNRWKYNGYGQRPTFLGKVELPIDMEFVEGSYPNENGFVANGLISASDDGIVPDGYKPSEFFKNEGYYHFCEDYYEGGWFGSGNHTDTNKYEVDFFYVEDASQEDELATLSIESTEGIENIQVYLNDETISATEGHWIFNEEVDVRITWDVANTHDFTSLTKNGVLQENIMNNSYTTNLSFASPTAIKISAQPHINKYLVTFYDGNEVLKTEEVNEGETIARPENPTKDGQVFVGWYTTPDLTEEFNFETTQINTPTSVYAKWRELSYTDYNIEVEHVYGDNRVTTSPENLASILERITNENNENDEFSWNKNDVFKNLKTYVNELKMDTDQYKFADTFLITYDDSDGEAIYKMTLYYVSTEIETPTTVTVVASMDNTNAGTIDVNSVSQQYSIEEGAEKEVTVKWHLNDNYRVESVTIDGVETAVSSDRAEEIKFNVDGEKEYIAVQVNTKYVNNGGGSGGGTSTDDSDDDDDDKGNTPEPDTTEEEEAEVSEIDDNDTPEFGGNGEGEGEETIDDDATPEAGNKDNVPNTGVKSTLPWVAAFIVSCATIIAELLKRRRV